MNVVVISSYESGRQLCRAGFACAVIETDRRFFRYVVKACEQLKSLKVPPRKSWINQAKPR
jgi:hypothetical protein